MENNQAIQGANANQTIKTQFEIPFDMVELPSKGVLYPNNLSSVKVEHVTAQDENILTSANLIKNGKVLEVLMEKKVKDLPQGFGIGDMLVGDRNAIILFLRSSAYGSDYSFQSFDPETGETFEATASIDGLAKKELEAEFNENREFSFTLPKAKKNILFRLLVGKDEDYINQRAESQKNKLNGVVPYLTTRLETQIMSVDGNRDKLYISSFVNYMFASDALALREYIDTIEPGIVMESEVATPTGKLITVNVPVTPSLFWPQFKR